MKRIPEDATVFIYALRNPLTQEVRYIGATIDPMMRLRAHREVLTAGAAWVGVDLAAVEQLPEMEILQERSGTDWEEAEQHWIAHYQGLGAPLINRTVGGQGAAGLHHRPESRALMGAWQQGRHLTEQQKVALLAGAVRANTPERAAKISAALKGRRPSAAHRAALSQAKIGKPLTPALIAAAAKARQERWKQHRERQIAEGRAITRSQLDQIKGRLSAGASVLGTARSLGIRYTTVRAIAHGTPVAVMPEGAVSCV